MPRPAPTGRAYKETTLQQLRSFFETARLGSFTAAAAGLGTAHTTVWQQVHALERRLGAKLVEPFGRGCRLTDAGRVLADLAAPVVTGFAALERRFREAVGRAERRLVVATTPRTLTEDLLPCVAAFEGRTPGARLTFREFEDEAVVAQVADGAADVGFAPKSGSEVPGRDWVVWEPCYRLDTVLLTPPDHPLARRRHVRPPDLGGYPLVHSPTTLTDPLVRARIEQWPIDWAEPRRVEATFAASIRRCVAAGFGIGLISRSPLPPAPSALHERPMTRYFGGEVIHAVWRKGAPRSDAAAGFVETVKGRLGR
ncbi:MAG: LysR family transcriptional regulator [Gemmataceae bacterium]|nr:LysR family transcriptional regulator [Gemmataceae bacterium]